MFVMFNWITLLPECGQTSVSSVASGLGYGLRLCAPGAVNRPANGLTAWRARLRMPNGTGHCRCGGGRGVSVHGVESQRGRISTALCAMRSVTRIVACRWPEKRLLTNDCGLDSIRALARAGRFKPGAHTATRIKAPQFVFDSLKCALMLQFSFTFSTPRLSASWKRMPLASRKTGT